MKQTAVFLVFAQLVDGIGLGLLLPVLPYFVQGYGASSTQVTLLVAVYALTGMVFSPLFGRCSDVIGRKPLILSSCIGSAISYLLFLTADSLAWIFVIRIFSGITSAKSGVVSAWMIDSVQQKDRARYLGLLGSMNGVGMLVGPLLASVLLWLSGDLYNSVFICGAILSAIASVGITLIPNETILESPAKVSASAEVTSYSDLLALNCAIFLVFGVILSTSIIYMQARFEWQATEAGIAIASMTGCIAITRALIAYKVLALLGNTRGTWLSSFCMSICLIIAASFSSPILFIPFYCLGAAGYAIAALGVNILLADRVPSEQRGQAMGRLAASSSGAIVLGAATNGYLFDVISASAPFLIYATVNLILTTTWFVKASQQRRMTYE